jgi:hypothetical protein
MSLEHIVTPIPLGSDNRISLAHIYLRGLNAYSTNHSCATSYFCAEGNVFFFVKQPDGDIGGIYRVRGEAIRIPVNTPYIDFSQKGARLLAVSMPGFDQNSVEVLPITAQISDRISHLLSIWEIKDTLDFT